MAKKNDKKKKQAAGGGDARVVSLAMHPRAARDVLRARGWGGLAGFALVAWLAFQAGAPVPDVALRAIVGGTVGALVGWAAAVVAWRALVVAELRAAHQAMQDAMTAPTDTAERATA